MNAKLIVSTLLVIAAGLAGLGTAYAQNPDGPAIAESEGSAPVAWQLQFLYTGSNVTSVCYARSTITTGLRAATKVAISAATNANPVVFTSTGHGFAVSSRPTVTISGGTGSWTATNHTYVATIIDADTFSVPVNSTTFGALVGTVVFTTTAPRATMPEWAVQQIVYSGANPIWKGWLSGSSSLQAKCSDATSTTISQQ